MSMHIHRPRSSGLIPGCWSRRKFLRATVVSGFAAQFLGPGKILRAQPKIISANGKLNHACIGTGGMGWNDLQNFLSHKRVQVVALCDVDAQQLEKAAQAVPGARLYADWRELLLKEGDRIDSVNVSVPDHMHFPIAYAAIEKGKHVYCQKPMCHDVAEVRALTELSIRKKVISQLGTQLAAGLHARTAVGWVKEG